MQTLFILNDPPYGSERSYNGLRLAKALAKQADQQIRVFLMGDAVACAKAGQTVPEGYYNAGDMVKMVAAVGEVGLCATCLNARGIADEELVPGALRKTLADLAAWTAAVDKVLVFSSVLLLVILAGAATGIVLGLFGSGGSIIAMPALMVLLNVEVKSAIAMSLGIVAITATITAWDHWRRGNVDVRVAAVFGLFGIVGTFAGAKIGVMTPVVAQLVLFALVMYAAAWKMLKPALVPQLAAAGGLPPPERAVEVRMGHIAAHGIGVGVLTGVVGVGGGFLIVPALALLSGLRMKLAIGTSLAIVAAKSYAGFFGYLGAVPIDWRIMASFTAVTIAGSFAGTRLAHRFSQEMLKRGFGGFLVIVATYILIKSAA